MNRNFRVKFLCASTVLAATVFCVTKASAFAQQSGPSVSSFTVDAGGGTSSGGSFVLSGTIGQPDASGALSGGTFDLHGGFWPGGVVPAPDCPADITGNDVVDIDDLVAVVLAWGACPAPPATCSSDIAPPAGNGVVNIDDLVIIITGWGACP